MDMKLELVGVPVTDIDRAKEFYVRAGFNADHDHTVERRDPVRPAHPAGLGLLDHRRQGAAGMTPGSLDNMQMVVADADETRADLLGPGIEVSEVDEQPWGRFVYFSDPDGNRWALQQLPDWSQGAGATGCSPMKGEDLRIGGRELNSKNKDIKTRRE